VKQTLKKMKKIAEMRVNEMNVLNNAFDIVKKMKKIKKIKQYKNADKNADMMMKINKMKKKIYIIISIVTDSA